MKKILVIGSAVADVIIHLDHLPRREEDVHVISQEIRPGGCGYNVCDMIRHFGVPVIPFFPVGTGPYGDFIRKSFRESTLGEPLLCSEDANGCCYCFVEADGERTFISHHGAEYRFRPEWFETLDASGIGSVYICGLEIEEPTGCHIVGWLEKHPALRVFFAPGPRIMKIDPSLMKRIFALSPVLHLNREEAISLTGTADMPKALSAIAALTGSDAVITLGAGGCLCGGRKETRLIPGFPAVQADTIGAGDAHVGALMACMAKGMTLFDAARAANRISAAVVETPGALLSSEAFRAVLKDIYP